MTSARSTAVPIAMAIGLSAVAALSAIYVNQETRRVPVARLVANLERKLAEEPNKLMGHINLARLHGMAFALKSEEVPAAVRPGEKTGEQMEQPWYGNDPKLVPYRNRPAATPEADAAARVHLAKALAHYQAALEIDPDSQLAQLGYGWMLDQAGRKAEAIEQYRRVIADAWPKEQDARVRGLGRNFFTREAIDYLIPLLDPQKHAAEIADLRARAQTLDRLPRAITPIAVPLRDDLPARAIHDVSARVRFDADGTGVTREWTWLSRDAAWLVYDADGRGEITSALQLFGNVTFWLFWADGYEALSSLDDDRNGLLEGEETKHLGLWHDRDGDGSSDRGEVSPLSSHGIVALSCRFEQGEGTGFAAVSPEGARFAGGRTRPTYDVILRSRSSLTLSIAPHRDRVILHNRAGEHEQREQRVSNPGLNPRQ